MSLSLASNQIGDKGATKLGEVSMGELQNFSLWTRKNKGFARHFVCHFIFQILPHTQKSMAINFFDYII